MPRFLPSIPVHEDETIEPAPRPLARRQGLSVADANASVRRPPLGQPEKRGQGGERENEGGGSKRQRTTHQPSAAAPSGGRSHLAAASSGPASYWSSDWCGANLPTYECCGAGTAQTHPSDCASIAVTHVPSSDTAPSELPAAAAGTVGTCANPLITSALMLATDDEMMAQLGARLRDAGELRRQLEHAGRVEQQLRAQADLAGRRHAATEAQLGAQQAQAAVSRAGERRRQAEAACLCAELGAAEQRVGGDARQLDALARRVHDGERQRTELQVRRGRRRRAGAAAARVWAPCPLA